MSTEKKWKHGDIGLDGRIFVKYCKTSKNNQRWETPEKFRQNRERDRLHEVKRHKNAPEKKRKTNQASYKNNPQAVIRKNLKKSFQKRDGSSLGAFLESTQDIIKTLSAIMKLKPISGKSQAQTIHYLSGYKMSVCQEIADLCAPEITGE